VLIAPIYTAHEIKYLINDSGSETILCQDTNLGYVERIFPETCLKTVVVTNITDLLPWWKRAVGVLFDKIPHGSVGKTIGEDEHKVYFFKDLITHYKGRVPQVKLDHRTDICRILYTGGTTGFPKGVPMTHTGLASYLDELRIAMEGHVGEGGQDAVLTVAPLYHEAGLGVSMAYGLNSGNPLCIAPLPIADAILEQMARYDISLFFGVPALFRMILECDRLDQYKVSTLRLSFNGADRLAPEISSRWEKKFGYPIFQAYGATEVGFVSIASMVEKPKQDCVGVPLPTREVLLVDPNTLKTVSEGEVGEALVHVDHIPNYYWNKPDETADSYIMLNGKTYYRTRDYLCMRDCNLFFVDRSADRISYKGYRISASEIETVLQDHPAVIASCVIGVPDPKVGERVKAAVVLREDAKGVGASELMAWCRERLAPYKVPRYIEFRDMLPKSKVGKLLRREIREEERRKRTKGERHIKL
jgi:long-chain acyl-CoA synthetase